MQLWKARTRWQHHLLSANLSCNVELSGCNIAYLAVCRMYSLASPLLLQYVPNRESVEETNFEENNDFESPKSNFSWLIPFFKDELERSPAVFYLRFRITVVALSGSLEAPSFQARRQRHLLIKVPSSFLYYLLRVLKAKLGVWLTLNQKTFSGTSRRAFILVYSNICNASAAHMG